MQQHLPLAVVLHICLFHISFAFLKGSSLHEQEIHPTCDPGHFPCNSTGDCVEQKQNCDGKLDCEDGSDEWHCEDQNTKMLFNSQYRKRPDEDREKQVESCQLSNVSSECHCSGLKLYCDHQELKSPPYLPENITELHLSGNRLHVLEPTDFQLREQLHTLILTSSEVKLINKDALKNLPHLMRLHLPGNHITVFANGTLAANKDLRLLVLSHNPLSVLTAGAFDGLKNLDELDLRDCQLEILPIGVFDSLVRLRTLWLDGNLLSSLNKGLFRRLNNLEILSISRNEITVVDITIWHGLTNLQRLSMSQNGLYSLESATFGNLTTLLHLDLHGNKIRSINKDAFLHLTKLESLNLRLNELRKPTEGVFDSLESLDYIYFDDFHLCSLALHVRVCEPRGDGISSIAHLLDNVVLRVSVWLVAVIAFVGNVAVLVGRLFFTEPNEVHSFYIKNLSLADLLMSVYLFIIAAYDVAFRGKYIFHETHWRHSWQCNLCGFLSTLSSESSVLILTIITIDRYLSIIHPLSVKKRAIPSAAAAMALAWVIAIILSALPILNISYYGDEFYGNNGVCLPLHIHDPFGQAWEYSTFLFCGANLAAFLFIAFAYVSMFFTISNSKIGLRCTQQQQDRNIAKRFAFIVATDFLCWVPIICIKVVAMAGVPIQEDLYAWVAVFLLPVNSAINPILYTLTTKLFKQHLAKIVYNFKVSTGASADSMTPSAGRNHSLRDPQRNSLSQGDHNNINMTTTTICHDCRRSQKSKGITNHSCRQCRRLSARKKDSFKISSNMV